MKKTADICHGLYALFAWALLLASPSGMQAAPPDLTAAGAIAALKSDTNASPAYRETYNLGPTGLRGWIYIGGGNGADGTITTQSRQILITVVGSGTPGAGVLAVDDVILGVDWGQGTNLVPLFASDARKSFGAAIGEAEQTVNGGILRLKRWRAGVTNEVTITLPVMGSYTATAPYSCPKSALILANARNKLVSQLLADPNFLTGDWAGAINGLALLAGVAPGDANYATVQNRLQSYARARATAGPQQVGLPIWDWGYTGLFLAEYYLSTGDDNVVTGVNNYTIALARAQSMYGTFGHDTSVLRPDGSGRRLTIGYGPVNQVGIAANIAIVMGSKALVAAGQPLDAEIDPAIQRGSDFFAWYVNKGPIPYGEHEPFMDGHSSNGKDPLCAVLFGLQANRTVETEYFSRMTTASFNGREYGHTGQGFSYLWSAMGANMGGALAVAEYLKPVRWHLDLERRTDGSFVYDGQEQYGAGSTADGTYLGASSYYGMNPTASYVLTYSLPLQRLHITGKNANPANTLDASKVANAVAAASFKQACPGYTTNQLIASLSEFDPVVRHFAAIELGKRSLSSADLATLRTMVTGTNANGRMGACQALGLLKDSTALLLIAQRLDKNIETNSWVRAKAASAIRSYTPATASVQRDPMLINFVANATDPDVVVWDDPIQIANNYLSFALFGDAVYGGNSLAAYTINASKNLLRPAVTAGLKQPDSISRSGAAKFCYDRLTLADVQALPLDFFEVIEIECQADRMWGASPRSSGIKTLAKYKVSEGIPLALAMLEIPKGFEWGSDEVLIAGLNALATYGDAARWTLPALRGYLGEWNPTSSAYTTLLNSIASIEAAITSPSGLTNLLPVANSQAVTTTNARAITLTGFSCRTNTVTFMNVTTPAHGTLTGTAPNLTYTPTGGYVGLDSFTFQVSDSLTNSAPGTVNLIVGMAAGTGLKGEYYDNMDFTGLKFTRTDPQVSFDWGAGSPSNSMAADTFSVRWTGLLLAPESGNYRFSALNSDGVRLYVNGVQVIDDLVDQVTSWNDGAPIALAAGQKYEVQMDYYENIGSAVVKLKWIGPSFAGTNGALIAREWLYDGTGVANREAIAYSQSVTMLQNTNQAITLQGVGNPAYSIVTLPAHGTLTGTPPNVTYTPAMNFTGLDGFTFVVNNGLSNSAPAAVSIAVWAGAPVSYTWKSAASGNWSIAGNWVSTMPTVDGEAFYTLDFTPSGTYSVTNDLSNGFLLNQLNVAGAVTFAGANSLAPTANGPQLPQINQNTASAATFKVPLALSGMTVLGGTGGGQVTIPSVISGAGGLVKNSSGLLEIYGLNANTFGGGTIINSGTLHWGTMTNGVSPECNFALGTGPVTLGNGATLEFDRVTATNALILNGGTMSSANGWGANWNGPVTLNSNTTIDTAWNMSFGGKISGAGGFTKTGGNTLSLSGNNSFTGANLVTSGTLKCNSSAALGAGPLSISNGAIVNLNYSGTRTIAALTLGGTNQPPGIYGSASSTATTKDSHFTGAGKVMVPAAASLTNTPATGIATTAAALNATLACLGTNIAVYAHWNTVNGGANAALWTNSVYVGSWTNVAATNLSLPVSGLSPQTQYYFTFRGTNLGGNVWATNVLGFTTLTPPPPIPVLPAGTITMPGGVPGFSFATMTGYKYRLAFKDTLTDAVWLPVIAPPDFPLPDGWSATSTGIPMSLSDTNAVGQPQRFYRLEARNP